MFKKIALTVAAIGMLAGSASAAELNIYGASAQYKFWSGAAETFLTNNDTACGTVYTAEGEAPVSGRDTFIAKCSGTTDVIRVTANKSSEGVNSVQGDLTFGSSNPCNDQDDTTYAVFGNTHREMAMDVDASGNITYGCGDVNIGASDVAASTFNQTTYGIDNWFVGLPDVETVGGEYVNESKYWWSLDEDGNDILNGEDNDNDGVSDGIQDDQKEAKGLSITGYAEYRPVIVPFSFFVNASVPVTNLTTNQIRNILAGKIQNWNLIVPTMDSMPITVCGRHAGSGTLATTDAHIMRGEYAMLNTQMQPGDGNSQREVSVYLNTSSTDLMKCVASTEGAIGYADADKVKATATDVYEGYTYTKMFTKKDVDYGYVRRVQLDGFYSNRENIINGSYGYWAAQWLYADVAGTDNESLLTSLVAFASSYEGIDAAEKEDWWVAQDEMNYEKDTDFSIQVPK